MDISTKRAEAKLKTARFLLHTRTLSLDYDWIGRIDDHEFMKTLEKIVLYEEFGGNQLNQLPDDARPVTAFFKLHRFFVLMIAGASKTRLDGHRSIFQRAFYIWPVEIQLKYNHLSSLRRRLAQQSEEFYRHLENKASILTAQNQSFEIDLEQAKSTVSTENLSRSKALSLPFGLTWREVLREQLTLQVPYDWEFDQVVSLCGEQIISDANTIHIGIALPKSQRFMLKQCRIISVLGSEVPTPIALDATGKTLFDSDVKQIRSRNQPKLELQSKLEIKIISQIVEKGQEVIANLTPVISDRPSESFILFISLLQEVFMLYEHPSRQLRHTWLKRLELIQQLENAQKHNHSEERKKLLEQKINLLTALLIKLE